MSEDLASIHALFFILLLSSPLLVYIWLDVILSSIVYISIKFWEFLRDIIWGYSLKFFKFIYDVILKPFGIFIWEEIIKKTWYFSVDIFNWCVNVCKDIWSLTLKVFNKGKNIAEDTYNAAKGVVEEVFEIAKGVFITGKNIFLAIYNFTRDAILLILKPIIFYYKTVFNAYIKVAVTIYDIINFFVGLF